MDLETLLAPVTPEDPCGADLEYDPAFSEIDRLAQGKAEQQIGNTIVPAEEPDWKGVQKKAGDLLGKSKDLRVGAHLTRSLLHTLGWSGFALGLGVGHRPGEAVEDTAHDPGVHPLGRLAVVERLGGVRVRARVRDDRRARLVQAARDAGAAVLVNLPFGRNSLFRKAGGRPLPDFAAEFGARTWAQFFLKFILGHPAVTAVIPGTDKPEYMLDNLQAGRGQLPDAAMRKRIVQYWDSLG